MSTTAVELDELDQIFWITRWNLLPLVLLVVLSVRKVPASLALMAAAMLAGVIGRVHAARRRRDFDAPGGGHAVVGRSGGLAGDGDGFSIDSGIADIDRLLSRGGMDSMLLTTLADHRAR